MSAFQTRCEILEKRILSFFDGIFAGVNGCNSVQNSCLRLDLVILWPKVAKSYGISKIHVFLGLILAFLWSKVPKNYGVSKICVFLHPDMLKFCLVGELTCWGCELEIECQILYPSVTGKVRNLRKKYTYFWAILACVVHALSESESFVCWGQGRKHTCT